MQLPDNPIIKTLYIMIWTSYNSGLLRPEVTINLSSPLTPFIRFVSCTFILQTIERRKYDSKFVSMDKFSGKTTDYKSVQIIRS